MMPSRNNALSLNPERFVGCPAPVLMAELGRTKPEDLPPQGQVDLHCPMVQEPVTHRPGNLMTTTVTETDLPGDHPEVDIPGVVLESYLGGGGQGWVYAGRVVATGRLVAVKVLRGDYVAAGGWAAREAQLCARVRHRNILRVFQTQPVGAFWVVIMELIQGKEWKSCQISITQLRQCLVQLADALRELHRRHIVHCDIKPGNILLRHDGSPVVVDFGVAWDLSQDSDWARVWGTPYFLAPEAFSQQKPHPSWDAYALGVTCASVLQLHLDYKTIGALRQAKLSGDFHRQLTSDLQKVNDDPLRHWLLALLSENPKQRLDALDKAEMTLAV